MIDKNFDYLLAITNGDAAKAPDEMKEVVRYCLGRLEEDQKNILILHFWDGKDLDEISYELKKRRTTVEKTLKAALDKMKSLILDKLNLEEKDAVEQYA